jgi:Tol biopolymer transport system component
MWIAAMMLVGLVATALVTWGRRPVASAPEMRLDIATPPTTDLLSFALSPNGRDLVYVAGDDGRSRLWLRVLADGTSRPLDGTDGAQAPFWSPDSLSVGFFAEGRLKILDVAGRSVRTLASAAQGIGGAWSRAGVILYAPNGVSGIVRVASTGGSPQPASALLPSQRAHSFPQFLPDDHHFLFYAPGPADTRGVYVGELDSQAARRLVDADAAGIFVAPDQLLFVRQGALLAQHLDVGRMAVTGVPEVIAEQVATDRRVWRAAVSADDTGVIAYRASGASTEPRHIWFDRSGREVGTLGDHGSGNTVTLSPDQKRAAMPRPVDGNTDLWTLDIARGILERFTSDSGLESHPLWSPDSSRMVFQRFTNNRGDIYVKPVDGGTEQLVLSNGLGNIPTDWSTDGTYILYKQGTVLGASWDILAMRIDGDRKPIPVAQTPADEREGQFSPDGKWVAYQSDETGQFEIYIQPFQRSGRRERVSPNGGAQVRWRADGKELFYLTLDGEMMSVPIQFDLAGDPMKLGAPVRLFMTRIIGVVVPIARQQYTPSLDGQRFLVHSIVGDATTTPPITLILNRRRSPLP